MRFGKIFKIIAKRRHGIMKKTYLYAMGAVLAWSTMPVVGKTLLTQFSSLEVLGYGALIGAVFFTIVLFLNGEWKNIRLYTRADLVRIGFTGFFGYFLYSDLYNHGLDILPAHIASTLNYTWPIFAVIFSAIFLKEKITVKSITAIGISMAGICVMMLRTSGGTGGSGLLGYVFCLTGAMLYAIFNIGNKKTGKNQLINMTLYLYISGLSAVIFNIPHGFTVPAGVQWIGFLWLGIVIDALAYLLWATALQEERTSVIVNFSYLTPVLAVVLSFIFFHEEIHANAIAGLVLILAGVVIQTKYAERESEI